MDAHLLLLRQTNLKPPQIVFGSFMFMSPASRLTSELQAKPFLTKKKKGDARFRRLVTGDSSPGPKLGYPQRDK